MNWFGLGARNPRTMVTPK